jgi:hypothetical protein
MIVGFLIGVIVTTSLTASLYFLKFWKQTRDPLFLAFSAAFLIEGINRLPRLFIDHATESSPTTYVIRGFAFLLLLGAILFKNRR